MIEFPKAIGRRARSGLCVAVAWVSLAFAVGACVKSSDASNANSNSNSNAKVEAGAALAPPPQPNVARIEVPASLEQSCREICDRSRRLNCENARKCIPNCLAMASLTPCSGAFTKLYTCLVGQPVSSWECAPDGVAAIREGFCDGEQGAAIACMEAQAR